MAARMVSFGLLPEQPIFWNATGRPATFVVTVLYRVCHLKLCKVGSGNTPSSNVRLLVALDFFKDPFFGIWPSLQKGWIMPFCPSPGTDSCFQAGRVTTAIMQQINCKELFWTGDGWTMSNAICCHC